MREVIEMRITEEIPGLEAEMTAWRHHLHTFPETAFQEQETSDFLAEKLESFGLDVHRGSAKRGSWPGSSEVKGRREPSG